MKLALKNSAASLALPEIATAQYRTAKNGLVPFKSFVPENYSTLGAPEKKALRVQYEGIKKAFWRENKAIGAAVMSHEGLIVRSVKVKQSAKGVVSFSISGGEPPKAAGKAIAAQSALAKENEELKARLARMEALIGGSVTVPAEEVETLATA